MREPAKRIGIHSYEQEKGVTRVSLRNAEIPSGPLLSAGLRGKPKFHPKVPCMGLNIISPLQVKLIPKRSQS